uniref:RING-H2 finger protein ATL48 n=1 Tax=Anthurium amnicola TaxID=1678845 RepID=A0A1D1XFI2_9ARAE
MRETAATAAAEPPPQLEELFERKKPVKNPLVPVGALLTAGVLTAGLISFRQGNSQLGQKLMRARVVVQGATVALMIIGFIVYIPTCKYDAICWTTLLQLILLWLILILGKIEPLFRFQVCLL